MAFPARTPLYVRLWAKVDTTGGPDRLHYRGDPCWVYTGYIGKNRGTGLGYGQIRDDCSYDAKGHVVPGRLLKAHRVALIWKTGEDRPGWDACHKCDHTVCCHPEHLFWGTHRENMAHYIAQYGAIAVEKRPLPPRPALPFEGDEQETALARAARLTEVWCNSTESNSS